jgi:hypothetical protein
LDDKVVDAHGDEVDADRVVPCGLDRQFQLGADTVGGADEDRVVIAGCAQVEEPAEAAEAAERTAARGCCRKRLDGIDEGVACLDVDARILVADCDGRLRAAR